MQTNDVNDGLSALDSYSTTFWLVQRRYRRLALFLLHATVYFSLLICYTTIFYWWYNSVASGAMLFWGMLLVAHMAWALVAGQRDRELQREIEWAQSQTARQWEDSTDADELIDLKEALATRRKRRG